MPHDQNRAPEPESLKMLAQFMSQAKQQPAGGPTPEQMADMQDNAVVMRIYAEMKWRLKKRDWTYREMDDLFADCQREIEQQVESPAIREKAIQKFQEARNKLSEFTEQDERVNSCDRCGMPMPTCVCQP